MAPNFLDYYDRGCPEVDTDQKVYTASRVSWIGTPGQVLKIPSRLVSMRVDNVTDIDKIKSVAAFILCRPKTLFNVCLADVRTIDAEYVQITQAAAFNKVLYAEYGIEHPFTTGDTDLDLFITCPKRWIEANFYPMNYITDSGDIVRDAIENAEDSDEVEDIYSDLLQQVQDMRESVREAKQDKAGDLGQLWAVMRDGNHRTQGALQAGEGHIYVKPLLYNPSQWITATYRDELI